jgi:lipoyl(octanoyl) transferase
MEAHPCDERASSEMPGPGCYRPAVEATLVGGSPGNPRAGDAAGGQSGGGVLVPTWLGTVPYRRAWALQKQLVAARVAGRIDDQLLLLEHPRVLTLGRGANERHIRASVAELAREGIEVLRVERGGEVTYHGPGQLVAYPILGLSDRGLLLRPLVRALEAALVETCRAFGVAADRRDGHRGCWCDADGETPRKIGALGLRVERGVTYHGIALNVTVDLSDFELIDACGMPDVVSTSIAHERGRDDAPSTASVPEAAVVFARSLGDALAAPPAPLDLRPAEAARALELLERKAA